MSNVRTRFAPSPTGTPESIHLGFLIRALWSFAFAVKNGGKYVLRIEDTDQKRSRPDTEQRIYEVMKMFGVAHHEGPDVGGDFGPYRQSERLPIYQEYAHKLVEIGAAYYDFDAEKREKEDIKAQYTDKDAVKTLKIKPEARSTDPAEAKKRMDAGEPFVIRAKMPENQVFEYEDWILRKKVKIYSGEINDLILLKSDGFPTYHLAVVIDDHLMEISHVFRGMEWISTTPLHLFIYDSLGWTRPEIGHFPVIMDPRTGKKFSKRDMTSMFGIENWLKQGYLREALLNYLMMLGWAPKDNRELFTLDEFIQAFDQSGIQKANPTFNPAKLDWYQGQYVRQLSLEQLYTALSDWFKTFAPDASMEYLFAADLKPQVISALGLLHERVVTFTELIGELNLFFTPPTQYEDLSEVKGLTDKVPAQLIPALHELKSVVSITDQEEWVSAIRALAAKSEWKDADMFMLLRVAIWGKRFSPPLFEAIQIVGVEGSVNRIESIRAHLQ